MKISHCFYFPNSLILSSILLFLFSTCHPNHEKEIEIRGVYGSPEPLWDQGFNLNELGVNAVFVHSGSINEKMVRRARSEGLRIFAEFATLNGKNYVEEHPEAWAIDEKGVQVESASWFMGVCPTEPGFREYRFSQLRDLMASFDLDGIWMDYVHWHAQFEEPEPILPETCFCDHCLKEFSDKSGFQIPDGSTAEKAGWILENKDSTWRSWRCEVIADWVKEFKNILHGSNPDLLLGLYHCPWDDQEFNGARKRILGLDYDLLKESVDVFSPMVYHGRMGRSPEWVGENIRWFCDRLDIKSNKYPKVWPIVQAYNDPHDISGEEFELVLKNGLTSESSGVMMFTTRAIADDPDKIKVLKKIYMGVK